MKRTFFIVLIATAVTTAVFAQNATHSYTVQSVTGRVQREAGNSRVDIAAE